MLAAAFLGKRLTMTIPVMAIVAVIVFAILRMSPGDPAIIMAGDNASPEQLAEIRRHMGLDQPIYIQFVVWLGQVLRGDFGTSLISNVPVIDVVSARIGPSLALGLSTMVLSVVVAIPLGVLAAWSRGTMLDKAVVWFSVIVFSVPVFVVGYLLAWIFAVELGWLPVQGYRPLSSGLWNFGERLILPTVALSTIYIALIARITRSSVIEVMGEDFIRTARAKGLRESAVLISHALGNAAVPIVTIIGIGVAMLIGGVVVTESVFNIPGLGRLVVEAVLARDYPVIQALILLFALANVGINLAVDMLYTLFDPRIRH